MAQEISAEIMREAREIANCFLYPGSDVARECADYIARALLSRDTAARKECAEIARNAVDRFGYWQDGVEIATAIEASIGGGDG